MTESNANSITLTEKSRKDDDRVKRLRALSIKLRSSYFPEPEQTIGQKSNVEPVQQIDAVNKPAPPTPATNSVYPVAKPKTRTKRKEAIAGNLYAHLFNGSADQFSALSAFDLVKLSRKGFPKHSLLSLAKNLSLTVEEIGDILHISERTLQRYGDETQIKAEYAEKAVELIRLYNRGEEVFGSMDKFKRWVKTSSYIFAGEIPVSLLDTSAGFDMVFKELGRIEHGIFA